MTKLCIFQAFLQQEALSVSFYKTFQTIALATFPSFKTKQQTNNETINYISMLYIIINKQIKHAKLLHLK